jgi:hypothetical protein
MAEVRSIGIKSLKIGDILPDGGMATTLAALAITFQGSAILETGDPTVTNFFGEESDDPIETTSTPGVTTLKWAITDFDPDTLVKVFGGTKSGTTPEKWLAPAAEASIEKSIELISKKDLHFEIPRAKIMAKLSANLGKENLAQIVITATVLVPTKADLSKLTIFYSAS